MYCIEAIYQGEFESKGSKFLSFLAPFEEFESLLDSLKSKHLKAVHFVYATRWYQDQIFESFSDDGEPKGSSGMPMLNVLRGEELINVGGIVVRYFGGTLLGVGGLMRAYTKAIQDAVQKADLKPYEEKVFWEWSVKYPHLGKVEYLCKTLGVEILKKDFEAQEVLLKLSATSLNKQRFIDKLGFAKI